MIIKEFVPNPDIQLIVDQARERYEHAAKTYKEILFKFPNYNPINEGVSKEDQLAKLTLAMNEIMK